MINYRPVEGVGMKLKRVNKLIELLDKAPSENELWVMYRSDRHGVIAFPFTVNSQLPVHYPQIEQSTGRRTMSERDSERSENLYQHKPFDYKSYRNFYELLGGAVVVLALVCIGVMIFGSDVPGYWQNIYITGVGAVLTVGFLERQAEHRAIRQRKEELIWQMGSPNNEFAIEAVRLLGHKKWLFDGSLKGARFEYADLHGTNLCGAELQDVRFANTNLRGAYLIKSNLQGAHLYQTDLSSVGSLFQIRLQSPQYSHTDLVGPANLCEVNLKGAYLRSVNLQDTHLADANLQDAHIIDVNLQGADLENANLQGAHLEKTNLQNAVLWGATVSPKTILPDGSNWTPGRDVREFTHPDEWKAEQAAKQGGEEASARADGR